VKIQSFSSNTKAKIFPQNLIKSWVVTKRRARNKELVILEGKKVDSCKKNNDKIKEDE
jgi:hypothetical protein